MGDIIHEEVVVRKEVKRSDLVAGYIAGKNFSQLADEFEIEVDTVRATIEDAEEKGELKAPEKKEPKAPAAKAPEK